MRCRGDLQVRSADGQRRSASTWLGSGGRPTKWNRAPVKAEQFGEPAVGIGWDKRKEPWCLTTSLEGRTASETTKPWGHRLTIEDTLRDARAMQVGMGLKATHTSYAQQPDKSLMLTAIAHALRCLLRAAIGQVGLDPTIPVNTIQRRIHSIRTSDHAPCTARRAPTTTPAWQSEPWSPRCATASSVESVCRRSAQERVLCRRPRCGSTRTLMRPARIPTTSSTNPHDLDR